MEAVSANGAGGETAALSAFGRQWGTAEMFALGRRANENPRKLYTFNPKGFRRDVVEFHPAYHDLMRASIAAGLHASTWTATGKRASPPAEVARAARYYHEDVGVGRRPPVLRVARVQMQYRSAGLGGIDRLGRDLIGSDRQRFRPAKMSALDWVGHVSAREIRPPSRSTRARSFADKKVCISSTRFHGAKGVSRVERGTNSEVCIFL